MLLRPLLLPGRFTNNDKHLLLVWMSRKVGISTYSTENQLGTQSQLLEMLNCLEQDTGTADFAIYARLLQSCSRLKALAEGKRVHAHIVRSGFEQTVVLSNHLLNMYGKCGDFADASSVFHGMSQRNVISWTGMIAAYAQQGHTKEAFQLLRQMQLDGVKPDKITFVNILNACTNSEGLEGGVTVHGLIVEIECEQDVIVGTALINMYGKCGSLADAQRVFDKMHQRNVVSWNTMIAAYARKGQGEDAFQLFQQMQLEGPKPDNVTLVTVLGVCRDLQDAQRMFSQMDHLDVVSWNAMLSAIARHGHGEAAISLFWQMQLEGVRPDNITFITVLDGCASVSALPEAAVVQACLVETDLGTDVAIGNSLVNIYSKCGSLEDAQSTFEKMQHRNVVSWTAMISGYAQHGRSEDALQLFQEMQLEGVKPNKVTHVSVLNACDSPRALSESKKIHGHTVESGYELDVVVATALVNMYSKCGSLEDARALFGRMDERDVVSWNAMIAAYVQHGYSEEALRAFRRMHAEGFKPSNATFVIVLNACANLGGVEDDVESVFEKMDRQDVVSWNAMISTHTQQGEAKNALQLFLRMQLEGVKPNRVTFVSILNACANPMALAEGRMIHSQILESGGCQSDALGNALVNMYGKCGSSEGAGMVFDAMDEHDVISWNSLIGAYAQHGKGPKEALCSFGRMLQEGLRPNNVTFILVLDACASLAALSSGRNIHSRIVESGLESDGVVANALIHMYGKCGSLENARRMFEKRRLNVSQQNVVSWSSMIAIYCQHGNGEEAVKLFKLMQTEGVKPNEVTLISVLSACSHAGLVEQGLGYFVSMKWDYGITPVLEHCECMVDVLGRAGWPHEAEELINRMPFRAGLPAWMALLSAWCNYGDAEGAKRASERVLELDPHCAAAYVVLSNVYAAAGRWNDAAKVRNAMTKSSVKKEPGRSSIEVNNRVHEFLVGDRSHPRTAEIYKQLEALNRQMEAAGYKADTKLVLHGVEEEQEQLIRYHSEKLAIAFGLISSSSSTSCDSPLRIINNIRVCNDCHTTAKFVSRIANRDIFLRDANRFHHMRGGACSCGDYW